MPKILTTCAHCERQIELGLMDYPGSYYPIHCPACGKENDTTTTSKSIGFLVSLVVIVIGIFICMRLWNNFQEAYVTGLFLSLAPSLWLSSLAASRTPRLVKYKKRWLTTSPPESISDQDRERMKELGISHNGQYFIVVDMHFDRLHDAIAYAQELRKAAV